MNSPSTCRLPGWSRQGALWAALCLWCCQLGFSQPDSLPWPPDPECGSIVTTGIAAVTCGTIETLPVDERFTFGLIDINGALPAAGRIDVTASQAMYHHPSWHVDSIGNVFGITMDRSGNTYLAASSNYGADYLAVAAILRYGEIGGGAEDLAAAGTVYRIDGLTGQASVFAVLPQQEFSFTHPACETGVPIDRVTGPGLGNIVYSETTDQFYVSNFEDGRIYRLDAAGNILDSYDPLQYDNGDPGTPELLDLVYGLDVTDDGGHLFFGTAGTGLDSIPQPAIYSIALNTDGSFNGTINDSTLPVGATWNNWVGLQQLHYVLPPLEQSSVFAVSDPSFVSDLEFTPSGTLLVGNRAGCDMSVHSSYNHGGNAFLLGEVGGIYNDLLGVIYTTAGSDTDNNAYGGVAVFENPSGENEFVLSSADMLSEDGPHGICTQPEGVFGTPGMPAAPAGLIGYIPAQTQADLKGIGGDVYVFKACEVIACPTAIEGEDAIVCGGEPFDLQYTLEGDPTTAVVVWTDAGGAPVDPVGLVLDNAECAPAVYEFTVTAVCVEDTTQFVSDVVQVLVGPNDLSAFITVIEEPCFVDVVVDSACVGFLTVMGDIPVISPGDSGTAVVQIVHNLLPNCNPLTVELNYNCVCNISELSATPGDCDDGEFFVTLDFLFENVGAQFKVTDQDGNDLGTFDYADLPVEVGPFVGDPTITYTLTVMDIEFGDCMASIDVGPVDCSPTCMVMTGGAICEGEELLLMEVGGDAVTWSWSSDLGADIVDPMEQNTAVLNAQNGEIFTVTITNSAGVSSSCSVTAVVNDLPVCEASNDGPICAGDSLHLSESGGDALSWMWSSDGGAVFDDPTAQNPTATNVSNGETFTVVVTDANGCMSSCTTTAEVFDPPTCNAGNDGPICIGETLQLTEDGGDAVSWMWSTDGGAVISDPTVQNPTATNVSDGETFTVVITDANGCTSSCSTTATVLPPPTVEADSNSPICEGDLLWLTSEVSGGTPPYTYSWTHPNGFMANTASVFISNSTVDDAGTYTLEVTDAAGCSASSSTSVVINFNLTDPGEIGGDEYFCGPGFDPGPIFSVSLPSGAVGPIEYIWMKKEAGSNYWEVIPGATGPTYDPGPIYVTTQYMRCARIFGCLLVVESNIVTKTIGTEAIADPTGSASPCVGELELYSVTPQMGATYSWNFGAGATPQFANTPEVAVTWNSMGLRKVTVTVTTATCTANNYLDVFVTDSPVYCAGNVAPSGKGAPVASSTENTVEVFPNPFTGELQIKLARSTDDRRQLQVFNLQGISLQTAWIAAGDQQAILDLSGLPAGVYILAVDMGVQGLKFEKIVKR